MLRTLKRFGFNTSELITVYRGYIRPIITEYTNFIWHSSHTLKQSQTLESIQRRAFKIMLGYEYASYINALEICDLDLRSVCSARGSLFEFCMFSAKIWAHQNANPPADRRFMANSWEIALTSLNYVHALTDSLKAPYPTTLACLIPPSLSSWWLLRCPCLWWGFWPPHLFASAYFLLLIYCIFCVCLFVWRNSALGLRCYAIKITSYHII